MSRYQGLDPKLKQAVFARDGWRCRWCGTTNSSWGYDAHHIEYRRGYSYDRLDNLITLCRTHHDYVHNSHAIAKALAQEILAFLISNEGRGQTGTAVLRRRQSTKPSGKTDGRLIDGTPQACVLHSALHD